MNDVTLLLLILIGKAGMYALQKSPVNLLVQKINKPLLSQLFSCNFCLGTWIYFFLSAAFHATLFKSVFYCPVVSELLTGAMLSLAMHLFSIGWNEWFGTLIVGA